MRERDFSMKAARFLALAAVGLAAVGLAAGAAPCAAQAPALALLERVAERARGQGRGVDGYTLELSMLGETGIEIVRPGARSPQGVRYATPAVPGATFGAMGTLDALALALHQPRWIADHGNLLTFGGVTEESGAPAYVITAVYPLSTPTRDFNAARGFIAHVDTATLQVRRLELEFETWSGAVLWMRADYSDFRPVGGFRVPFARRMAVRGLGAIPGMAAAPDPGDELVIDVRVTSARVNPRPPAEAGLIPRYAP
jgi:hypothetical protein